MAIRAPMIEKFRVLSPQRLGHAGGFDRMQRHTSPPTSAFIPFAMQFHDTEIRVRYEDADPMGFLHHARYFAYFEVGRLDLFRSRGGDYRAMEEAGLFVVVAKAACRYRKPARFDDLLTVRTIIQQITPAKIVHEYKLLRGEELLAEGEVTLALVNREGHVQRIPDWFRDAY